MKHFISIAVGILLLIVLTTNARAQNQQRREFIQGLLQGLLESQVEKNQQPLPNGRPHNGHTHPGRPLPNPQPARPGVQIEVSPAMLNARRSLTAWNSSASNLVNELRAHEQQSPQLRPLLVDAMRLQASVASLSRRAELMPTTEPLANEFSVLDRDWRVLSTRIKQSRGIPAECSGFITAINDLDTQLCSTFGIQPSVDRAELARLATTMSTDFDHLLRGVYYSSRGNRGGDKLMREGQALQVKIGQAASLVNRGSYESMVNAFRSCVIDWKSFSQKATALRDQRLRFSIQHIEDTGRKIQEQLWLPVELDRTYLAALTESLAADADRMFHSVTMSQLLASPRPNETLAASREFVAACNQLNGELKNNVPEDKLEWSYRLFATKFNDLNQQFRVLKVPAVDHQLDDITLGMNSLGEIFGADVTISHDELVHLFSELDALTRQSAYDAHQYIDERRYSHEFHESMCGGFDQLQKTAYDLHRQTLNPRYKVKPKSLTPLFNQWNNLRPLFAQCKGRDKARFAEIRRQIEPMMVKLQVLYGGV